MALGEGVGVLLLQHKYEAIRAHNHIDGIIKGSAVNHGGRARSLLPLAHRRNAMSFSQP